MDKAKIPMARYDVVEEFSVEDFLQAWVDNHGDDSPSFYWNGIKVKSTSKRLRCIVRSCQCVECGLVANIVRYERGAGTQENPHFNFYNIDENGDVIMLTRDHVIPRSWGGADTLDNSVTMCGVCNFTKGNKYAGYGDSKTLRNV